MADYRNCSCIACKNVFEPDDDIVVCPECGTPYHRDCWHEHDHCINTKLHENGGTWQNPNSTNNESNRERVLCMHCGELNPKGGSFCIHCGKNIKNTNEDNVSWQKSISDMLGGFQSENQNEDMGGATLGEIKDFVGKNIAYYLTRFRFFFESKKKLAPNFICIIFPQFWFAYRKMWLGSLIIVLLTFLLSIPSSLMTLAEQTDNILAGIQPQLEIIGAESAEIIRNRVLSFSDLISDNRSLLYQIDLICSYVSLALRIVLFLFGNYIYYRHCIKKIGNIRESQNSLIDTRSRMRMAGGTNIGFIFLAILIEFVLTSILTYAAIIM